MSKVKTYKDLYITLIDGDLSLTGKASGAYISGKVTKNRIVLVGDEEDFNKLMKKENTNES